MFTVNIEKYSKRSAHITVSYKDEEGLGLGTVRTEYVSVLFGDVEKKAVNVANKMVERWKKQIEYKKKAITYNVA
ncbi:hypothetical protein ACFU1R_06430 [Priestia megaterium]|uniref:hypothetical protein n=1 Tax=Priestia megaterium TaxID=1404 RepID=UPI00366D6A8A